MNKRVAAGVEVLDEYFFATDWAQQIDLHKLNMADTDACVLGQLFGDYVNGLHAVAGSSLVGMTPLIDWSTDHGFIAKHIWGFGRLTRQWIKVIASRKFAVPELVAVGSSAS